MHNKIIYLAPFHYSFCPHYTPPPPPHTATSFLSLFFLLFIFSFLFHLSFLLALTLIIGIFYYLNYTSPLLHFVTTHPLLHLCLSSIIFIISTVITGIFYCLNYTSTLLHLIATHLVIDFIIPV